jgi:DegV family protein with EDD domain
MRTVGLVVDSTFGLALPFVKKHNITVVPLHVYIDGKAYIDGEIDPALVIQALEDKKDVKTSQPSPETFVEAFKTQLETYEQVLCLTLSKTLSGTYNSAMLAAEMMNDSRVLVIDTETTICGGEFLSERAIEIFEEGRTLSEGADIMRKAIKDGYLLFTVDNLQTLARNGRLGRVSAFIGNIMKVKPILRFKDNVLEFEHKVRSFPNVLLYLIDSARALVEQGETAIRVAYVDQKAMAERLINDLKEALPGISVKLSGIISPVISAHVGLGGLGVYLAKI